MSSNAEERQGPGSGPTVKLSTWVSLMALDDVPDEICVRAKYLILDGIRCGLVGAHLPWSEKAANVMFDMESAGGDTTVFGWERKITPLSAALLNSAFIQAFELDDWHSEAPLHSNSILLPSLFAAAQHLNTRDKSMSISGADFLLATIVGYEAGPRVGNDVWGTNILTQGWHSGAVFGPAASAAAVSKLIGTWSRRNRRCVWHCISTSLWPHVCTIRSRGQTDAAWFRGTQWPADICIKGLLLQTMYKRAKARIIRKISAIMLPGGLKKFVVFLLRVQHR